MLDNGKHGVGMTTKTGTTTNLKFIGNVMQGNKGSGAILIGKGLLFEGNSVLSNGLHGIQMGGDAMTVRGNTLDGNALEGAITEGRTGLTFTENIVSKNGGAGVRLRGTSLATISKNSVFENGGHGIFLQLAASGITISQNTVAANGVSNVATFDNIRLDSESSTNVVDGNTCKVGEGAAKPAYGVRIFSAGCSANKVTNNKLSGGGVLGGLLDKGTATTTAGNTL